MIKEYFCTIGCYLNKDSFKAIVTMPDSWTEEDIDREFSLDLYYEAREMTEDMHGMHGFGTSYEEFEEFEEDCFYEDIVAEEVEEACEYNFVPWNEEHAASCTYASDSEPSVVKYTYK